MVIFPDADGLFDAVNQGNIDKVNRLIDNGADVNEKIENGITPILFATHKNNPEVVNLLLTNGTILTFPKLSVE